MYMPCTIICRAGPYGHLNLRVAIVVGKGNLPFSIEDDGNPLMRKKNFLVNYVRLMIRWFNQSFTWPNNG